ncbi:MAG: GTA head formation protein, RCAP_rcc01685 family [Planktomarina sp.]
MTDQPRFRYGYDPAAFNPQAQIEANERLTSMQFDGLNKRLDRIEEVANRLEKRLWLTVYGVVAAILSQAFTSFLTVAP